MAGFQTQTFTAELYNTPARVLCHGAATYKKYCLFVVLNMATFDPSKVTIHNESYGENDEGDYDSYTIHILKHGGEQFLEVRSFAGSNRGGAWGEEHTILKMDGQEMHVQKFTVGGTVGTGGRETDVNGSPVVYDLKKEWEQYVLKKEETGSK